MTAEASENVQYMCSATPVCGDIWLTITIEDDGNQVATANNSVTWTSTASNAANSAVTCMSTIQCPSVTITGELSAFYLKSTSLTRLIVLYNEQPIVLDT